MQGTPCAALRLCSLHPSSTDWEAMHGTCTSADASGARLGGPRGAIDALATQHAVRTAAGVYSLRVTEFRQQGPSTVFTDPAAGMLQPPEAARTKLDADVAGRPCVAFLHGFLGSAHDWCPVAAALMLRCRCFAVDLPAHGSSRLLPSSAAGGLLSHHLAPARSATLSCGYVDTAWSLAGNAPIRQCHVS